MHNTQSNHSSLFAWFSHSASEHAKNTAIRMEGREVTYEQCLVMALRVAGHLKKQKDPGDRVGLLAPNFPAFVGGFFGILAADKEVVPFNALLAPQELAALLKHSEIRILYVAGVLEPAAREAIKQVGDGVELVLLEPLLEEGDVAPIPPASLQRGGDDLAVLLYTSGTTGRPKGVMLSHRNILSNCQGFMNKFNYTEEDQFVCILPFFHSFALTTILVGALFQGATIVLFPKFHPRQVLEGLYEVKSGVLLAIPTQFLMMAKAAKDDAPPLTNIRLAISGGAALLAPIQQAFEQRFGIKLLQGYGLTEAAPVIACNEPETNRDGTVGTPLEGLDCQVWDEDGNPLPPGEVGELVVKGDNVMLGYLKDQSATDEVIVNGYLRTGDMAAMDEEGFIQIRGRKKELIISAGENIYPGEIEDVLMRHPGVAEAAVVGVPDDSKGEVPKAFIIRANGRQVDVADLRRHCRDNLAAIKVPETFEIVEDLPRTPSGKIAKKNLVQ